MTIIETYLRHGARLHETGFGTAELSAYTPLTTLLNAIGEELTPGVTVLTNPGPGGKRRRLPLARPVG